MNMKKFLIYIASLLLVLLVACNNNNNVNEDNGKKPQNVVKKMKNDMRDKEDNVSSDYTNLSSDKYPHTQPFLVQQAKYKFYVVGPGQNNQMEVPLGPEVDLNQFFPEGIPESLKPYLGNAVPQQKQAPAPAPQPKAQAPTPKPAPTPAPQQQAKAPAPAPAPAQGISDAERRVIELTNAERTKRGLKALTADTSLSKVARAKSDDMQAKSYFSHTSPTYGSPFDMMRDFGITYTSAGENIAHGQQSPEQVVNDWMNSEGHRKNILSPNFTNIGVGYNSAGNYWTQQFIGK